MHHDRRSLTWEPLGDGWTRASVELSGDDSAWDPGSSTRVIHGPVTVSYQRAPSGATYATVERTPLHQALCSCGWASGPHLTRRDATDDGDEHILAMARADQLDRAIGANGHHRVEVQSGSPR